MKLKYTGFQIILEAIGLLVLAGMVIFVYMNWNQIPQQVPVHYNINGEIDRWGSKYSILSLLFISILLYIFITSVSFFPHIWNVPAQITAENEEAVYLSTKDLLIFVKVEIVTLFFYLEYHTITSKPLSIIFLPILLITLFGTIIFFTIRTIRLGKGSSQN